MNILIIGLGSIAKKHVIAIKAIDKKANIFALRSRKNASVEMGVTNLTTIDDVDIKFDFCIISNPTSEHFKTISKFVKLNVPLFIEKPSLMNLDGADKLIQEIKKRNILSYVAFSLRFHPVIKFLKEYLVDKRVIEVNIYCGSYLPDWRLGIDYTKNYSAIAKMGGGAHLDLIHEIDYAVWLFGFPEDSLSIKQTISDLNIDSVDFAYYHLFYANMVVNINLNYYRRDPKRELEIVLDNDVIKADLLNNSIKSNNEEVIFTKDVDKRYTVDEQMKYFFEQIKGNVKPFNTFEDSIKILKLTLK
jgi:predicted dehydrogenase